MRHTAVFSLALCAANPVNALDSKQCLPMAEMNATLKAEGQRSLIIANRVAVKNPTGDAKDIKVTHFANVVTSNADGSLGYQLEGNLPRAQASTNMCVAAKLTDIRLFDARKPGPPKDALLGGLFTESVRELAAKGTRTAIVANSVHREASGSQRIGAPLVVFLNIKGASGSLTTMNDTGPHLLAVLGDAQYTPEALRRLGDDN